MLGQILESLRMGSGWSVREVVKLTGIPRRTLYAYEASSATPSPQRLGVLMKLYKASSSKRLEVFEAYTQPRAQAA